MKRQVYVTLSIIALCASTHHSYAVREKLPYAVQSFVCSAQKQFENRFFDAIKEKNPKLLDGYTKDHASLFNMRLSNEEYPLLHALREEQFEIAHILIQLGADLSVKTATMERSALHLCTNSVIAEELLKHGALAFDLDHYNNTPLHTLRPIGEPAKLARLFIKQGVKVNAVNTAKRTALHQAADHGLTEVVKVLLENGANPNARDKWGNTPLKLARNNETRNMLIKAMNRRIPQQAPAQTEQGSEEESGGYLFHFFRNFDPSDIDGALLG